MIDITCPNCEARIDHLKPLDLDDLTCERVQCRKCGAVLVDCETGGHTIVEDESFREHGRCGVCWHMLDDSP